MPKPTTTPTIPNHHQHLTGWPYTHALPALNWGNARRITPNGRIHLTCRANPNHHYWLDPKELEWSVCPHCAGHWTHTPEENT